MKKLESKITRFEQVRKSAKQMADVVDNPNTPAEVGLRIREAIIEELDDLWEKLDTYHPLVIRELYPLLQELSAKPMK